MHHPEYWEISVNHFMNEMSNQQMMMKLRSYMKLYTSISMEKLGRLVMEEDFESLLLSSNVKINQVECSEEDELHLNIMDVHYFIKDGIIHVDEADMFENYIISQITQTGVMIDVASIYVEILRMW
jgi:translation initiation factor 3 subunit L